MSWNHEAASVFGPDDAPTAWQRLDLSATVGATRRLVLLEVLDSNAGPMLGSIWLFRPAAADQWGNDTQDGPYGTSTIQLRSSGGEVGIVYAGFVLLETDTSGVIEWQCNTANNQTALTLVGWEDSYHHHGVNLYTGVPPDPSDWTDLDLSPYIGTRETLTLCSVQGAVVGGVFEYIALRPDTDLYTSDRRYTAAGGEDAAGCGAAKGRVLAHILPLLTETDAAGEIEFYNSMSGGVAGSSMQVDLLGHVPHWDPSGTQYGPLAGVAAWTDLDVSGQVGAARTLVALEASHDGVAQHTIAVRAEASGTNKYNIGDGWYSAGTAAATCEVGKVVVLSIECDAAGVVEWITDSGAGVDWTFRVIGSVETRAPNPPGIDLEYPVDGALVAQDTEVRFRVYDDYGIDLTSLHVSISCVDQSIALIAGGAFTASATGVLIPITGVPGLTGYTAIIRPVLDLADRVWTVTVNCEDFDGEALP